MPGAEFESTPQFRSESVPSAAPSVPSGPSIDRPVPLSAQFPTEQVPPAVITQGKGPPGAGTWISTNSRPGLCVRTSLGRQRTKGMTLVSKECIDGSTPSALRYVQDDLVSAVAAMMDLNFQTGDGCTAAITLKYYIPEHHSMKS